MNAEPPAKPTYHLRSKDARVTEVSEVARSGGGTRSSFPDRMDTNAAAVKGAGRSRRPMCVHVLHGHRRWPWSRAALWSPAARARAAVVKRCTGGKGDVCSGKRRSRHTVRMRLTGAGNTSPDGRPRAVDGRPWSAIPKHSQASDRARNQGGRAGGGAWSGSGR